VITATRALAPGTVVYHASRGYGVLTSVNLMTGWVSARFGDEHRTLELSLSCDSLHHADGEPILFRRTPPDYMPHARLMAMQRWLHQQGFERLYLYTWPKPSGMHWRWHLFSGRRDWVHRTLRAGWHGSGAAYNVNPIMGWGDRPGASAVELAHALMRFDAGAMALARGKDSRHTEWFEEVCQALLPHYAFSLGWQPSTQCAGVPRSLTVIPVSQGTGPYAGPELPFPPGWSEGWAHFGMHRRLALRATLAEDGMV
jgi:hypothetical protein